MEVLLDFHYSDDWADGDKQIVPKAWRSMRDDTPALAQAVYDYTFNTLRALDAEGLMPDQVQVGNETNPEMMGEVDWKTTRPGINWERNAALFNAGIKAVRDAGAQSSIQPLVMLHIAQPENVEPWFADAWKHGVTDFDLIGVSYYRKWSTQGLDGLEQTINRLRHRYPAEVVVVETAYPFTTDSADNSPNLLGEDSLLPGYPATYEGQRQYMHDLTQRVKFAGGVGVVYWEPAWVSTPCSTRWGQGSNWENAIYFDWRRGNEPTPAAYFAKETYQEPAPLEITVRRPQGATGPLWLWGDFLGANDMIVRLSPDASDPTLYRYTTTIRPDSAVRFQVYDQRPFTRGVIESGDLIQTTVGREGLKAAYTIRR
ncbi:MAG: glycosyl hydrolase family 53 [Caulobacterales bacterium RIFOXYB1_FULL_67_16]|nr:MAG: glycosyl hydrolase family 53 [Caulobacterales bacterium RIFOXYB1_FULL_67_16]